MIAMEQFYDSDQLRSKHIEFLFIDRNDTTRMFESGRVVLDESATDPLYAAIEEAYRTAPGVKAMEAIRCSPVETALDIKRAVKGAYLVTVYDARDKVALLSHRRVLDYYIAVARTIKL